jgi:Tol biopolymer transport system component
MMRRTLFAAIACGLPTAIFAQQGPAPRATGRPSSGTEPAARVDASVTRAIDALVEQLRRNPARPASGAGRVGVLLMDARGGEATLVAEEMDDRLIRCGSPVWSHDGRRILFDATTGNRDYTASRIMGVELDRGRLVPLDLGLGVSPALSPSGDRVLFFLNPGAEPGEAAGVRIMNADGSGRRMLGGFGRPRWSADGHQFLIISYSEPCEVTMIDDRPGRKSGVVRVPDMKLFGVPDWVEEDTILAVIGRDDADTIAFLDVSDPNESKVKEVLWTRRNGPDVKPFEPAYSPATRRCIFAGTEDGRRYALYGFQRGKPEPPARLEREGLDGILANLAFSPDGRYLLFRSDRTDRRRVADHDAR